MKVELKISNEVKEPYAVIFSDSLTDEVTRAVMFLENTGKLITAEENGRISILQPEEIFMVRVENERTVIYCQKTKYFSSKRLYQLEEQLGKGFMKISKSTVINLSHIKCVEPSFKGMMNLVMKNGCKDYISRKYLPNFKKYLGI
ncbi:MAG: LytTR family DNA-binding domain-containing protein [Ruminococcus sp.]|nr:LytTR family DNA-binding domain-containing protein [Ruminococcus sp.]